MKKDLPSLTFFLLTVFGGHCGLRVVHQRVRRLRRDQAHAGHVQKVPMRPDPGLVQPPNGTPFCFVCFSLYRPGDAPEYNSLYAIPAVAFLGGYGYAAAAGLTEVHQAAYLAASLCCVGALGALSSQKTSRIGNNIGIVSCGV